MNVQNVSIFWLKEDFHYIQAGKAYSDHIVITKEEAG